MWRSSALLCVAALAAYSSAADDVCDDIAFCRALGDTDQRACKVSAKKLLAEAQASGCGAQLDAFFACEAGAYRCDGNTPSFPGCDAPRATALSCLDAARARNACGALDTALAACGAPLSPGPVPSPCSTCTAQCYLDAVRNVCTPVSADLAAFEQCARDCPL